MKDSWRIAGCAAVLATCIAAAAGGQRESPRAALCLDGQWQFRMDPKDEGPQARWFDGAVPFDAKINVPAAWDAQGFGQPTDKLRHNFVGKGWYRRRVAIPRGWQGRRVFLTVGGVHRSSQAWVNGVLLGEHVGYLSDFEYDVTPHVAPGQDATITFRVDSKQRWDVDCLTGCVDIIDEMFTNWGGLWGHVALEARGPAWLEGLFVQPRVEPASCRASAILSGTAPGQGGLRLQILDAQGQAVASRTVAWRQPVKPGQVVEIDASIPQAKLWSPGAPYLYTARLWLLEGAAAVDCVETRFGLREIRIDGPHILLNGKRVFLHGYGDDSVYPATMAPPADKAVYVQRLRVAKEYGFNFVRHHSHFLPVEYYDAADEVGMLISPELPIAYLEYYNRAKGPALELFKTEWASAIRRLRNHPSILDWCMGNEMWSGVAISPELYRIAKRLDPTRPVIDSDGLFGNVLADPKQDRATLDFYMMMFEVHQLPLDRPNKHKFAKPRKPVVSHETGNYGTFPRLDLIEEFRDNFRPFWLTPVRQKLTKLGLLGEADLWARNSERLYLLCHKLNIEDMRKNPYVSGHEWWLLQDYWTGSNGLVDAYFRPKKGITPQEVRAFNADVVVLQDGLPLTCRGGDRLVPRLLVSNYSPEPIRQGRLSYEYLGLPRRPAVTSEAAGKGRDAGAPAGLDVGQGEVKHVLTADMPLPDVAAPVRIVLRAELSAAGRKYGNEWTTWVYPAKIAPQPLNVPLHAGPMVAGALKPWGAKPIPSDGDLPVKAVYVMRQPSARVLDAVGKGACLVLLGPHGLLPTAPTRFKTSWWLGGANDCNVGTVVYDNPVTREMAPDGWCDAGWYRLLEGAQTYVLDALAAPPEVMVRAIDIHPLCRSKALLFQGRVGEGCVIVSGLKHFLHGPQGPPEAQWLLKRLIDHAATMPRPKAELPMKLLRDCAASQAVPKGPYVLGYRRFVNPGEKGVWHSYREDDTVTYCCRQSAVGTRMEWQTDPVPPQHKGQAVTFVFAGGLGWRSEPKTKGFALEVAGREVLDFDITDRHASWPSADGKVRLVFLPLRQLPLDSVGLFYLSVSGDLLKPGEPCNLGVVSKGAGSKRWFGLNPYTDVLGEP